jgi:hypothetical protein
MGTYRLDTNINTFGVLLAEWMITPEKSDANEFERISKTRHLLCWFAVAISNARHIFMSFQEAAFVRAIHAIWPIKI